MTFGVVASEGMLYREADHSPAMPRACFWRGAPFGPSIGRVDYDRRMEVALNGRKVDKRAEGLDKLEVTHGNVCHVCVKISLTRKGGVSGSDIG
jgi:hypothetical protein